MTSVRVGVEVVGRWRRRGGVNPLASAPLLIGLRVRVCGGAVGTTNVGSRAPACLTFYMALREGGPHCHKRQAPPIRARLESGNRSGDRSGEITFLTPRKLNRIGFIKNIKNGHEVLGPNNIQVPSAVNLPWAVGWRY
jgi:hypothetical protein